MRWRAALLALALIPLGLWMRFHMPAGAWLRDASGGVLYVMFWMAAAAACWPSARLPWIALIVFDATCLVEFSQAWHPAWLDAVRRTLPGRLVLGTTFNWGDFPPYAMGTIAGWLVLRVLQVRKEGTSQGPTEVPDKLSP